MIDHIIRFNSEKDAKADVVCGAYHLGGGAWRDSIAGAKVHQVSQDVKGADKDGETYVTRTYLPYWYLVVMADTVVPALRDHPACMLVIDRDKASPGTPLKRCIIKSAIPLNVIHDYRIEPVPHGSEYPFGEPA